MAKPHAAPEPFDSSTASRMATQDGKDGPATDAGAGPYPPEQTRPRHRFRRRWLAVLLGLVVIVAIAVLELPQFLTPAPTTTIWENITAGITDAAVPKQTALEAFAYLYQVDIPGVTVPKGIEGGDEPTDGSGALSWAQANWNSLTPDQQAVINRYLQPGPTDTVIPIDPAATSSPVAGAAEPQFQLDAGRGIRPIRVQQAADAPAALEAAMLKELDTDIAHIGSKLGMPVITGGSVAYPNIELILSDTNGGGTLFQTAAVEDALHYEPCHVTAFKNAWQGETVTGSGGVSSQLHVLMTHEVIHCYQNVVWDSVAVHSKIPPWITEGTALYLAADDTHIAESMIPSMWTHGWFIPETALTNRSYDAFGFYSLLDREGRNLWALMLSAWGAAAKNSSSPSDPFIAVLGGDNPDVRNNWAETYLRKEAWGPQWVTAGFDLPDTTQVNQHPAQAQPAPGWTGSLQSRSNTVLNVDSTAGEVVTVSTTGLASVHDNGGNSDIAFLSERFCTAATCICPKGTLLEGQDMAPKKMSIPFVAAFNAPEGGSKYSIVSDTLADLCGQKPTPVPTTGGAPGPCDTGCADTSGDPHEYTVNQIGYDFQAAGEFTLLRSADGSVDIQARQEPFAMIGQAADVSINTAIAAKVGSHRVGVYMTSSGLQAHVDGRVANLSSGPIDLGGGASISARHGGYEIDFSDGTKLWTLSVSDLGIDAQILPSASLKGSGVGLLGPVVPGGLGVPAMPDGTRLPAATDNHAQYDLLYNQFADAWRVTDTTTLFDYDAGRSTASYTVKPYPDAGKVMTLAYLSATQRAAGEAACSAITSSVFHDDCVLDVGVTGDTGFASTYSLVQAFDEAGLAPLSFPPASISPGSPTPAVVSGAVTVTKGTAVGGYAVGPDVTVFMSVQTAPNSYSLISFDPKAGRIVHQVAVPAKTEVHYAAGSVWLPGLITDSRVNNCSVTRFDAGTLAQQTTIPIPCADVLGPLIASDGSAIWFEDTTKYHPATKKGAVATRIDPSTSKPGTSVPMPSAGGYLIDSQGAVFYTDENNGFFRLSTGSTAFDSLGKFANVAIPAGTGLWVQSAGGSPARYFTKAGNPDHTIQIRGTLVAGDSSAAYAEVEATSTSGTRPELWRYPIDGSTPTKIALPPTVGGNPETYSTDPPPASNGASFVKIWPVGSDSPQASILLQWTPLH